MKSTFKGMSQENIGAWRNKSYKLNWVRCLLTISVVSPFPSVEEAERSPHFESCSVGPATIFVYLLNQYTLLRNVSLYPWSETANKAWSTVTQYSCISSNCESIFLQSLLGLKIDNRTWCTYILWSILGLEERWNLYWRLHVGIRWAGNLQQL